jgi:hypothetical protein
LSGPNDKLALTRWNRSLPLDYTNTVCMTRSEANTHDKLPENTDLEQHYGKKVYENIIKTFELQKRSSELWDTVL